MSLWQQHLRRCGPGSSRRSGIAGSRIQDYVMVLRAFICILAGGISFWGADALFTTAGGLVPQRIWLAAKSILLPLAVGLVFRWVRNRTPSPRSPAAIPYLMLAGIWLAGPVSSLLVNRSVHKLAPGVGEVLFTIALFPLSTVLFATYSGALGGLIIASAYLTLQGLFALSRE